MDIRDTYDTNPSDAEVGFGGFHREFGGLLLDFPHDTMFNTINGYTEQQWTSLTSILIAYRGNVIYERYFNGTNDQTLLPLRSMTKSVTSTLIGIAIDRGYIQDEHQSIQKFFDEAEILNSNPQLLVTTLHELLNLTSGIQLFDRDLPNMMRENPYDWIQPILQSTVVKRRQFQYKGCDMHLLSAILSRTTHLNAHSFAQQKLFYRLEIYDNDWEVDPQGNSIGSTGLKMTTRSIAKIGALYLNYGSWNRDVIISSEWVGKSITVQSTGDFQYGMYGYGWWIRCFHGEDAYMTVGAKGQYLINIPRLATTVVFTSDPAIEQSDSKSILVKRVIPILEGIISGISS
ncbi:serine hydrolase domain-containing protein [Alicyclobacillus fodiniaquatilis]|uniref:Serine hydrolase domain-containing protein n=1 Tax=Alicyclobacillus fodiniaquatilis TaxID=1661150 RepID=A0ABW4JIA9_9BACL